MPRRKEALAPRLSFDEEEEEEEDYDDVREVSGGRSRRRKEKPIPRIENVDIDIESEEEQEGRIARHWACDEDKCSDFGVWNSMTKKVRQGVVYRTRCIGENVLRKSGSRKTQRNAIPVSDSEWCEEGLRIRALRYEVSLCFDAVVTQMQDEAQAVEMEPQVPQEKMTQEWFPLPPIPEREDGMEDLKLLRHLVILTKTYKRRKAGLLGGLLEGSESMSWSEEVRQWEVLAGGSNTIATTINQSALVRSEIKAIRQLAVDIKATLEQYRTSIEEKRTAWIQENPDDPSEELRRMQLAQKFEGLKANIWKEKPVLVEQVRRELEERRKVLSRDTMQERKDRILQTYQEAEVELTKVRKHLKNKRPKNLEEFRQLLEEEQDALMAKTLKQRAYNREYFKVSKKMEEGEYRLFLTLMPLVGVTLVPDVRYGPHIHRKQHPRFKGLRFPPPPSSSAQKDLLEEFDLWLRNPESESASIIEHWSQKQPHCRTPEGVWRYRKLLGECAKRRSAGDKREEDLQNLKDLIVKDGHEILKHLTYKKFYALDLFNARNNVATAAGGEQNVPDPTRYEKMKAYQRKMYNKKKHGITLELGEYLKDRLPGARPGKRKTTTTTNKSNEDDNVPKARPRRQPRKKKDEIPSSTPSVNLKPANEKEQSQRKLSPVNTRSQNCAPITVPESDDISSDEDETGYNDDGNGEEEDVDSESDGSGSVARTTCNDNDNEARGAHATNSEDRARTECGLAPVGLRAIDFDAHLNPMTHYHSQSEIVHDQRRVEQGTSHNPFDSQFQHMSRSQSISYPNIIPSFPLVPVPMVHIQSVQGQSVQMLQHPQYHQLQPSLIPDSIQRSPMSATCSSSSYQHQFVSQGTEASYAGGSSFTVPNEPAHTASSSPPPFSANENSDDDDDDDDPQTQQLSSLSNPEREGGSRIKGSKNKSMDSGAGPRRQCHSRDIWNNKKRRKLYEQNGLTTSDEANIYNSNVPTSTTTLPISSLVSRVHQNATVCLICGHTAKDPMMLEKHLSASHPVRSGHDDSEEGNNSNNAAVVAKESEHNNTIANTAESPPSSGTKQDENSSATDINAEKAKEVEEPVTSSESSEDEHAQTKMKTSTPCKCQLCGMSVPNPYKLIAHVLRAHIFQNKSYYKCPFHPCPTRHASMTSLKIHIGRNHHSRSKNSFVFGLHTSKTNWNRAKEFCCTYCSLSFENRDQIKQHYKDLHENRRHCCPRCGLLLKMESHLTLHLQLFHTEKIHNTSPFLVNLQESPKKCKICLCEFTSNCYLLRHLKAGHNVSEMVSNPDNLSSASHCAEGCRKTHDYLCCFCGEEFEDKKSLQAHISSSKGHVSVKDASSDPSPFPGLSDPFKCELCPSSFPDFYILLWHGLVLHGLGPVVLNNMQNEEGDENVEFDHDIPLEEAETDVLIAAAAAAGTKPIALPPLPCGACGDEDSGLDSSTFHEGHLRYNILLVKTCEPCDRIFSRSDVLPKHLEAHHGIPRQDQVQPSKLSGRKGLSESEASSADQFVQCCHPKCKFFFSQEEFHKIHTLLKKDPDVRKCPECNLTFPTPPKLLKHRHVVHGLKMETKMITNQKYDTIANHIKIDESNVDSCFVHSTIDSFSFYSCKVCCNRHFKTRDFVVKHILESHEAYQRKFYCDQCNFASAERGKLLIHQKINHSNDVKLYQCPFCSMTCRYEKGVKHHVERVHGDMEKSIFTKSMIQIINTTLSDLRKEKEEKEGMELCAICNSFFTNKKVLKTHLAKHGIVSKDLTWCDVCGLQISRCTILKHWRRLHPEAPKPISARSRTLPSGTFPVTKLIQQVEDIYKEMKKELAPFNNLIKRELKSGLSTGPLKRRRRRGTSSSSTSTSTSSSEEEESESRYDDVEIDSHSEEHGRSGKSSVKTKRRKKGPEELEKLPLRRTRCTRNVKPVQNYALKFDSGDDEDDAEIEIGTNDDSSGKQGQIVQIAISKMPKRVVLQEKSSAKRKKKDANKKEEENEKMSLRRRSRRNLKPVKSYSDTCNFDGSGDDDMDKDSIQIKIETFEETNIDDNLIPSEPTQAATAEGAVEVQLSDPYDLKTLWIPLERCDALVEKLKNKSQSQDTKKVKNKKTMKNNEKSEPPLAPQMVKSLEQTEIIDEESWNMNISDNDDDNFADPDPMETFETENANYLAPEEREPIVPTSVAEVEIEDEIVPVDASNFSASQPPQINLRVKKGCFIKVKEIETNQLAFAHRYLRLINGRSSSNGNHYAHYDGFRYKRLGGDTSDPSKPEYFVCVMKKCKATLILHRGLEIVERAGDHEEHTREPKYGMFQSTFGSNPLSLPTVSPRPQTSTTIAINLMPIIPPSEEPSKSTRPLTASDLFLRSKGKPAYHRSQVVRQPPTPEEMRPDEGVQVTPAVLDHSYCYGSLRTSRDVRRSYR